MSAPPDFYALLEVPRSATEDDIRKAYKKLALVCGAQGRERRRGACADRACADGGSAARCAVGTLPWHRAAIPACLCGYLGADWASRACSQRLPPPWRPRWGCLCGLAWRVCLARRQNPAPSILIPPHVSERNE